MQFFLLYELLFLSIFIIILIQLKHLKKNLLIFSLNVLIWIFNLFLINNYGIKDNFYKYFVFTILLPLFICFFILSGKSFLKISFCFLTACCFTNIAMFIGFLFFFITKNFLIGIIAFLISSITILCLIYKFLRFLIVSFNLINKSYALLINLIPFFFAIINYILVIFISDLKYVQFTIIVSIPIFILLFLYYVVLNTYLKKISKYQLFIKENEITQRINETQKIEYDILLNKCNISKIFRHDLKHHIVIIQTFLENNNTPEALEYLKNFNKDFNNAIIVKYCDNYIINIILSAYIRKAEDNNIKVTCKTSFFDNNINNNNCIDFGIILCNAIDNAINACLKISNCNKRFILILGKIYNNQIYLKIYNPFYENLIFENNLPISKKEGHGFGILSIQSIVQKYNGILIINTEHNIFKTSIIIHI